MRTYAKKGVVFVLLWYSLVYLESMTIIIWFLIRNKQIGLMCIILFFIEFLFKQNIMMGVSVIPSQIYFVHQMIFFFYELIGKIIWPCNSDGSFSVKSCCTLIDSTSCTNDRVFEANVWIKGAPLKVQVFLWLAVQDKVSTKAFLHHRNVLPAPQALCVFCNSDLKTL
jgi:hypothetical protein